MLWFKLKYIVSYLRPKECVEVYNFGENSGSVKLLGVNQRLQWEARFDLELNVYFLSFIHSQKI